MPQIFQAPGKLILGGEYAVLQGHTAIVAAVARRAWATLIPHPEAKSAEILCLLGPGQSLHASLDLQHNLTHGQLSPLLEACLEELPPRLLQPGTLLLDSTELAHGTATDGTLLKLGLGSSAATAVCFLGAFLKERLLETADLAHRKSQGGKGSGIDIAAAVHGGLFTFQRCGESIKITPLRAGTTGCMGIACWTGQSASTPQLVAMVQNSGASVQPQAMAAEMMRHALLEGKAQALIEAVLLGHKAMETLAKESLAPLVLPAHQTILKLAQKYDGASKPTGAGGGDLALAVLPPGANLQAFKKDLAQAGFPAIALGLAQHGFGPPSDLSNPTSELLL